MAYQKSTHLALKYLDADNYIEQQCDGNRHLTSLIEAAKSVSDDRVERKLIIAMLKADDLLQDYAFFSWATDQICTQKEISWKGTVGRPQRRHLKVVN